MDRSRDFDYSEEAIRHAVNLGFFHREQGEKVFAIKKNNDGSITTYALKWDDNGKCYWD